MKIYPCGTNVKTVVGNIEGMISCCNVRFEKVQYEVTYFFGGEFKTAWMNEKEFNVANGSKGSIGFIKTKSSL